MTNFERWAEIHKLTKESFVCFYISLTEEKGCDFCPLPIKCDYVDDAACRDKFLDFADEESADY